MRQWQLNEERIWSISGNILIKKNLSAERNPFSTATLPTKSPIWAVLSEGNVERVFLYPVVCFHILNTDVREVKCLNTL